MSFINKSVNFLQTNLLKTEHLAKYLHNINNYINTEKHKNIPSIDYHIIPNNGIKYYLFITKKQYIENSHDNFNFLYFFPDNQNNITSENLQKNTISDFYMEIDNKFDSEYLFEGYLYKNDTLYNKYTYLLTDIYAKNNEVIKCDYNLRFTLINEIIQNTNSNLKYLNEHLTIGIHPVFHSNNDGIIKIFLNNFMFKEQIIAIEHVYQFFEKKRFIKNKIYDSDTKETTKKISKGKYPDVYNVYNIENGDYEGILYIKGTKESKHIKSLFVNTQEIKLICKYNTYFNKWYPIF